MGRIFYYPPEELDRPLDVFLSSALRSRIDDDPSIYSPVMGKKSNVGGAFRCVGFAPVYGRMIFDKNIHIGWESYLHQVEGRRHLDGKVRRRRIHRQVHRRVHRRVHLGVGRSVHLGLVMV